MRGSIALVVVGYNRPKSMRRILDSLNQKRSGELSVEAWGEEADLP